MDPENIYANTNFKNESDFLGTNSASPPDLQEKPTHKRCHPFPKSLFATFMIYFLLLTILFSVAFIVFFKKYSQILKEKTRTKGLNYTELECTRQHSLMEDDDDVWSCCPKNWKAFSSNCYFISVDSRSWNEGMESCSSMGAHLLVIRSKEEQDFITMNLDTDAVYYVGLSDPEGQRQWQWVDQTPYNPNATFWQPYEPNNVDERCVVLNHPFPREWGWNDAFCSMVYRFICQMKKMYL